MDQKTRAQGISLIKKVEQSMLKIFEGDDSNQFFEFVYMAYFEYYTYMREHD